MKNLKTVHLLERAEVTLPDSPVPSKENGTPAEDRISFQEVDIITPSQKLLARRLVCDIVHGKSLLVTGKFTGDSICIQSMRLQQKKRKC